jgi:PAS domain S-box-containing protein
MNLEHTDPRAELEARLRFETLIADLSSKFVNLPAGEVDREIMDAERRICESLDLDLLVLWQLTDEAAGYFSATHAYSAQKGPLPPSQLHEEEYPWYKQQLLAGRIIAFSSLEELPAQAAHDLESFRQLGIKSNLCLPLAVGGGPMIGAFSLNATRAARVWPDALVQRLQLVAQIFANALARRRAEQALRDLADRYRALTTTTTDGFWEVDHGGKIVDTNDECARLHGYSRDELLTKSLSDLQANENPTEIRAHSAKIMAAGYARFDRQHRCKDGRIIDVEISTTYRPSSDTFLAFLRDITERKLAEEALRTSEARLEAGADLAGVGYYEVDFDQSTSFADERFSDICGVPAGYEPGLQRVEFWIEHIHPDDRQHVLEERRKAHEGKIARYDVEYRYLHPAQGEKWIHQLGCVATRNPTGRVIRSYGVFSDITERKRLSERLQSAAEEWQTTFDSINDLVMILDREYRIVRVNAATVRFLGLPMERIVGSACFTVMHGTSCPIDGCPGQNTFQTNLGAEFELLHADSGKWLLISTDPIRDAAGHVIGAVHVARDISERKQAEAELHRLHSHLWHLDRVSQTGAITASLAHELNQPLTAILSNAQAGLRFLDGGNPDVGEIRAILTDIVHDDKRAGTVISGLRSMLRRQETPRETINLRQTIEEVLVFVHSELVGQQVELDLRLEPDALVSANEGQVQQVLLNLIRNAVQAMQDQPTDQRRLELTLTRTNTGEALVALRDSGPGIPEEQQGKLFEAFWTTKNEGLGIGLPISRSIIESHGGRLSFTNNPDQGATFSFTLPLAVHASPSGPEASLAAGPGAA